MIDRQEIEKGLHEIYNEANLGEADEERGDIDSIQLISFIVEIEERFEIEIPDEYLVADFLHDFGHVADVVEEISTMEVYG